MNNRETLTTSHTQDKINTMYPMLSVSLCCSSWVRYKSGEQLKENNNTGMDKANIVY